MKVEIKRIPKTKWHGNTKDKDISRPVTFAASVDTSTMQYNVKISDEDLETTNSKSLKYNGEFNEDWDLKYKVTLESSTKVLNLDNLSDRIAYGVIKGNPTVAPNLQEYENNPLYSGATHYIHSEEENMVEKAVLIDRQDALTFKFSKLSLDKKLAAIMVVGRKSLKGESESTIKVAIKDLILNNTLELEDFLNNPEEYNQGHSIILEALQKGVIVKRGLSYFFFEEKLGGSLEECVREIIKDDNQEVKLRILEKINN